MAGKKHGALMLVAAFKLVNAAVSILATMAIVHLFHKNVAAHAESWLDFFRIDTDNKFVGALLWRLRLIDIHELHLLAGLSSFYSALFFTEGVGLAMKQRWAEYLTLIATGLFIPVEVYKLCQEPSGVKAALLVVNVAIVSYLVFVVRSKRE